MARSTHPDVSFVQPDMRAGRALQIKIEDVRELEHLAPLNPLEGAWRIIIVDGAERMNVSTANALLKLLEEPPAHCKFFLLANRKAALLPTIRSRLMPLRLAPVPSEELAAWLQRSQGLDAEQAQLAARWSEGRPGAALSLPLEEWESRLARVAGVMAAFSQGGYPDIFKTASDLLALGKDSAQEGETPLRAALRWLRLWLRDRLVTQVAPGADALLTRQGAGPPRDAWTTESLCALGDALETLAPYADRPIDAQLGLEQALTAAGAARG
jgi:DNA polymerase-3 subunit delta'